jgi:uncharacterized protein YegL
MNEPSRMAWSTLSVEGGTNYGAAFKQIRDVIEADISQLKSRGFDTFRPAVFFLTDGEPLDSDWLKTFTDTLTFDRQTGVGMKRHPIFIPFGFRDAPGGKLAKLAYPPERGKYYLAKNTSISEALKGILNVIMTSVMNSTKSVRAVTAGAPSSGAQGTVILADPATNSGMTQGDSTYDLDKTD